MLLGKEFSFHAFIHPWLAVLPLIRPCHYKVCYAALMFKGHLNRVTFPHYNARIWSEIGALRHNAEDAQAC